MIYFSTYLQDLKKNTKNTNLATLSSSVARQEKDAWYGRVDTTYSLLSNTDVTRHVQSTIILRSYQLPESKWSCFMSEPDHPLTHYSRTELGVANDEALFDS